MAKQKTSNWVRRYINEGIKLLATSFYLGLIPYAPGTLGSLVGILLYFLTGISISYYVLLLGLFILGIISSEYASKHIFYEEDSPKIVIDETVGCYLAFYGLNGLSGSDIIWYYIVLIFVLFRIFDILKPYPIGLSEGIKGGLGIMLDDIIAGIYTILVVCFIRLILSLENIFS